MRTRQFTTPAYWPREHISSVHKFHDHFDVAYVVWDQPGVKDAPPASERYNLLFLHGSQLTKEIWKYYAELSFQAWGSKLDKVIAIDSVNHGDSAVLNSEKLGAYNSWIDLARDNSRVLHALIDANEISGPVIVIGHSMGGTEALLMGSFEPGLIAGVVSLDAVWQGKLNLEDNDTMSAVAQYMSGLLGKIYKYARDDFENWEDYEKFCKTRFVTKGFHPRIQHDAIFGQAYKDGDKVIMKTPKELQVGAYMSSTGTWPATHTIVRFTPVPVLAIRGDIEDWNQPGTSELLAEEVPNGRVEVVVGGGHLIAFEKPDEVFAVFKSFVEEQCAREIEFRKDVSTRTPREERHASIVNQLGEMKAGKRFNPSKI